MRVLHLKPSPSVLDLESNWVDLIVRQVRFVNENFSNFHSQFEVRRFCDYRPIEEVI